MEINNATKRVSEGVRVRQGSTARALPLKCLFKWALPQVQATLNEAECTSLMTGSDHPPTHGSPPASTPEESKTTFLRNVQSGTGAPRRKAAQDLGQALRRSMLTVLASSTALHDELSF